MDIQKMMEMASVGWQNERSKTQMTLGELILTLKGMDKDKMIIGICDPHSYREYYSDLAFELYTGGKMKVSEVLFIVEPCLDKIFCGYKGGDFKMDKNVPVWIAEYGSCGKKLIAINKNGTLKTQKDEY